MASTLNLLKIGASAAAAGYLAFGSRCSERPGVFVNRKLGDQTGINLDSTAEQLATSLAGKFQDRPVAPNDIERVASQMVRTDLTQAILREFDTAYNSQCVLRILRPVSVGTALTGNAGFQALQDETVARLTDQLRQNNGSK